jgi:hypothetical protein
MPKAIRNPANAIIEALATHDKVTWAELLKLTHLSKGALSEYIKQMINDKKIKTETDGSTRPPKTLYFLVDPVSQAKNPFFHNQFDDKIHRKYGLDSDEMAPDYTAFAIYVGNLISKLEDREKAKRLLNEYLKYATDSLISNILGAIWFTSITADGRSVVNNINSKKQPHPQIQTDDILQLWKKHFKQFDVSSMIEAIFWTAFKNPDIAFGGEHPAVLSYMLGKERVADESTIGKFIDELIKLKKKEATKDSSSIQ